MKNLILMYKKFFADKSALRLAFFALLMLSLSLIINFYAGNYASIRQSNYVTDIILSNTRAFDVDVLFIYSTMLLLFGVLIYCLKNPFQMPYIVKSIALFVIIRCMFIVLTHIWPYPIVAPVDTTVIFFSIFSHFSFTGDLFFSGHTGLPFLMALIFWKNRYLRYLTLAVTLFFATIVLLGHLHYSIDVLSAFFISYGIYNMSITFFSKDKKHFDASFGDVSI